MKLILLLSLSIILVLIPIVQAKIGYVNNPVTLTMNADKTIGINGYKFGIEGLNTLIGVSVPSLKLGLSTATKKEFNITFSKSLNKNINITIDKQCSAEWMPIKKKMFVIVECPDFRISFKQAVTEQKLTLTQPEDNSNKITFIGVKDLIDPIITSNTYCDVTCGGNKTDMFNVTAEAQGICSLTQENERQFKIGDDIKFNNCSVEMKDIQLYFNKSAGVAPALIYLNNSNLTWDSSQAIINTSTTSTSIFINKDTNSFLNVSGGEIKDLNSVIRGIHVDSNSTIKHITLRGLYQGIVGNVVTGSPTIEHIKIFGFTTIPIYTPGTNAIINDIYIENVEYCMWQQTTSFSTVSNMICNDFANSFLGYFGAGSNFNSSCFDCYSNKPFSIMKVTSGKDVRLHIFYSEKNKFIDSNGNPINGIPITIRNSSNQNFRFYNGTYNDGYNYTTNASGETPKVYLRTLEYFVVGTGTTNADIEFTVPYITYYPFVLNAPKSGYLTYTQTFNMTKAEDWTITMQGLPKRIIISPSWTEIWRFN